MDPKISIGMPVYNGENYLAQALRAILSQTFTDFELIISDNASTDATQRICETFAAEDSRVRYFRNSRNIGIEPNFNAAFEPARGKYFMWTAHDDLLEPNNKQDDEDDDDDQSLLLESYNPWN